MIAASVLLQNITGAGLAGLGGDTQETTQRHSLVVVDRGTPGHRTATPVTRHTSHVTPSHSTLLRVTLGHTGHTCN